MANPAVILYLKRVSFICLCLFMCHKVPYFRVSIPALTKRKGSNTNNLGKREFLPAVPPDDQYVLLRAESDWHWGKQSMYWHLSRKSNRMSSACAKQKFQHSTTSIDTQKKNLASNWPRYYTSNSQKSFV